MLKHLKPNNPKVTKTTIGQYEPIDESNELDHIIFLTTYEDS